MKALLDTHTFIWAVSRHARLSMRARTVIADLENELFVSAVTAWEIATKVRIGKLPEAAVIEGDLERVIVRSGYQQLDLSVSDALRAGRLVGNNRDPWDRMLAAQALGRDIAIVSVDPELDGFGVRRIW